MLKKSLSSIAEVFSLVEIAAQSITNDMNPASFKIYEHIK